MQLTCWALAPLSNELLCETGSVSHSGNPCRSPVSSESQFPIQPAPPAQSATLPQFCPSTFLLPPTSLVGLVNCFFNSLAVRIPCSLIFWHFWLFIVFRLVFILLLVVRGSEGFQPTPPSWPELPHLSLKCWLINVFQVFYNLSDFLPPCLISERSFEAPSYNCVFVYFSF